VSIQRQYLRAPVQDEILYVCDNFVLKGRCDNISVGGALLSDLSRVPEDKSFHILMPLIQYPEFGKSNNRKIITLERSSLEVEVIRAQVEIVRSFDGQSDVDKIFIKNIGTRFSELSSHDEALIISFVKTFTKNLVHLLSLFETHGSKGSNIAYLRKVASLLGYDSNAKLAVLRQEVLHDYQSLVELKDEI
jgi:hypothetical protein